MATDIPIGARLTEYEYGPDVMTGIDYLTGFEVPLQHLILVTAEKDEFSQSEARYITRFTYLYGVGSAKKPPCFVTESALELCRKARAENVPAVIKDYEN